jgi:hypothetical protein
VLGLVLFIGVFCAVGLAYACTEFLLIQFDVRQRVMVGESGLPLLLGVNCFSLVLVWLSGAILVAASGQTLYVQITVIAIGAQAIWLAQHLWFYFRDHLRVRYETDSGSAL